MDQISLLAELIAPVRIEHLIDPALVRAGEVIDRQRLPRARHRGHRVETGNHLAPDHG